MKPLPSSHHKAQVRPSPFRVHLRRSSPIRFYRHEGRLGGVVVQSTDARGSRRYRSKTDTSRRPGTCNLRKVSSIHSVALLVAYQAGLPGFLRLAFRYAIENIDRFGNLLTRAESEENGSVRKKSESLSSRRPTFPALARK